MRDIEAETKEEKRLRSLGLFIQSLEDGRGGGSMERGSVTGFTVRLPTEEEPSVLIVIRASGDEDKKVSFIGAYRLTDALFAWRARDKKGSMKWREDRPF